MPTRPGTACLMPGCPRLAIKRGYCQEHMNAYNKMDRDTRGSAAARGYDAHWRLLRAKTLRAAGIPESEWHKYRVDHRPRYDAARDPVHEHYQLVPMLLGEHSSKTNREDGGGFGGAAKKADPTNRRKPPQDDSDHEPKFW